MDKKKSFKIYYLLLCEGNTEYNLFAYLTKVRFRTLFDESSVKFSNKVEVIEAGISQGNLNGVGSLDVFKAKYDLIKEKYSGQKLFFLLDKDLDDSLQIENLIKIDGDVAQFLLNSSEHLLLKLAGKNPKNPSDFNNMREFRNYCEKEFITHFGKNAHEFKEPDFEIVFNNCTEDEIRNSFSQLFATLTIDGLLFKSVVLL